MRLAKLSKAAQAGRKRGGPDREAAKAQTLILLLVCFVMGIAVGAFWVYRAAQAQRTAGENRESGGPLSEATRTVLQRLKSPLEIRFYSILSKESTSDSLRGFAGRVDQLLAAYQSEANGRIKLTRIDSQSYGNANAAVRDGIKPFDAEQEEASFLGLAVVMNGQRESLPRLAPEWEPALEPDLTRAIARLIDSTRPAPPPPDVAQLQNKAAEEIKALIPDVAAVSSEEGTRILREAALKEFQAAVKEAETQLKEAQQNLADAQNKSDAEQQAARKRLLQIQSEQMAKLKDVAARADAQIEAFKRLKSATP
ncbi:MAG TPA: Gldg family protein [Verrucomicrobiae bacterium]